MSDRAKRVAEIKLAVDELRIDFEDHAYLLFSAGLLLSTGDYEHLMSDSVLDGADDKKIDFLHIDREEGRAVVLQVYERAVWSDGDPPANKASDLNTALVWLLDSDPAQIARLDVRSKAVDLRDALQSGDIHEVAVYYVHTCRPNANVRTELHAVEKALKHKLDDWAEQVGSPIAGSAGELSVDDVVNLYYSKHAAITVTDEIVLPVEQEAQYVSGGQWRGVASTIRASVLVDLFDRYGEDITSANIRDYLGQRNSSRNINNQISTTAVEEPENFWIYNNGLTLVTRALEVNGSNLICGGLAVANGAQTLGSLSRVKDRSTLNDVMLLVRVIESDPSMIENIIRFNNTQNQIKPWELRVLDPMQARIQEDFATAVGVTYQFRRGLGRNLQEHVHLSKLAPWLAAFNGEPIRAHRNSRELFEDEKSYRSLFNSNSEVRHLLAVYRIGEAVGATKDHYREKVVNETASTTEETLYGYFRYGPFTTVVIYLVSEVLAELFGGGPNVKGQLRIDAPYETDRDSTIAQLRRLVEFTVAPIPTVLDGKDAYAELRTMPGVLGLRGAVQVYASQFKTLNEDMINSLKRGLVQN